MMIMSFQVLEVGRQRSRTRGFPNTKEENLVEVVKGLFGRNTDVIYQALVIAIVFLIPSSQMQLCREEVWGGDHYLHLLMAPCI